MSAMAASTLPTRTASVPAVVRPSSREERSQRFVTGTNTSTDTDSGAATTAYRENRLQFLVDALFVQPLNQF